MESIKIEIECYKLWDVLECIKCEDIDDNFRAIRDYYIGESFPFIYLRHVVEFLDESNVGYDFNSFSDEPSSISIEARMNKFSSTPIDILG
jgi:hypothetical protein